MSALRASIKKGTTAEFLASLSPGEAEHFFADWLIWARPDQLPPDRDADWTTWLLLGGRGAGKTRAGAEWVRGLVYGQDPFTAQPVGRIALVGEDYHAAAEVMVGGVSGLLSIHASQPAHERPRWILSRRCLEWPNGAVAQVFSSQDPEALRGPQFEAAWCDEIGKWQYAEETWDMLQFGLRLGACPRQAATTTPRPTSLIKRLLGDARTVVARSTTRDNAHNLAPGFIDTVVARYGGTRLGRQELEGELLEDHEGALWRRAQLEALRVEETPALKRLVVAIDPPAGGGKQSDLCGLVVAARGIDDKAYVLEDASFDAAHPKAWAQRAVQLYHHYKADALLAEINQGGDMVRTVIHGVDAAVPVKPVRATRGKWLRAEPVALLYEQERVYHMGPFVDLEDEMCAFTVQGTADGHSPDRLDALVWAISELMLTSRRFPRLRTL